MMRPIVNVSIIGTGSYVPPQVITNQDIERMAETNDAWIQQHVGIKERHIVNNQLTSDLAAEAALKALENANLPPTTIDLIIVATATPDRLAPSTACIVQDKVGAINAVAFDLAAVCSGFLFAYTTAAQYIASGVYQHALVIGADTFSKITDWSRRDCIFFGDGAGAAVLSHRDDNEGFLRFRLFSDGRGKFNFTIPGGGSEHPVSQDCVDRGLRYFQMNGQAVFQTAIAKLPEAIKLVLADAELTIDDIALFIPHQPNVNILRETAKRIGLPFDKVMVNLDRYANTSGATIPIILDEVCRAGKIKSGDFILLAAVGSGWTWGASVIKWP